MADSLQHNPSAFELRIQTANARRNLAKRFQTCELKTISATGTKTSGRSVNDVDLERRTISVSKIIEKVSNEVKNRLKGGANKRSVGINRTLYAVLSNFISKYRNRGSHAALLKIKEHESVSANWAQHFHQRAIKLSALSGIRVHDLRHTFASHFVMNNGNISDLRVILDHSDIKTTLRYAHLAPEHVQKNVELFSFEMSNT